MAKDDAEKNKSKMTEERQDRLFQAVAGSYREMRHIREKVLALNADYAGPLYTEHGLSIKRDKFINMLRQAAGAYMTILASSTPRATANTHRPELRAFAKHYQTAINQLFKKIHIEDKMRQWVRDAFFWIGIMKVHMRDTGELVSEDDVTMDPGMPWCSNVAIDNFVYDYHATSWEECQFMGDLYELPYDFVKESDIYTWRDDERESLVPTEDPRDHEHLRDLSTGNVSVMRLDEMVTLCDIWVPRDGMIYTYVVKSRSEELILQGSPIAEMEWIGTKRGPYKRLHFDEVSENVMPCSLAADLWPLDRLVNNLFRKNARKAARAKEVFTYTPAGDETARELKVADDGDWVKVQHADQVGAVRHSGVDTNIQGFMLNSMELFDRMAGNLQSMLGLGASTDTVGQEKLVRGAASRREEELKSAVLKATIDLTEELAYLLWSDEFTELPSRTAIDGLPDVTVDSTWKPGERMGDWSDFQVDIDVYSMQYQGPTARLEALNGLLTQVYMGLMPLMQQQGGTIDIARLTSVYAELLNLPQLSEVVLFSEVPVPPQGQADPPRKPPSSNRTYTRRNVSANDETGVPSQEQWSKANDNELVRSKTQ